MSWVQKLIRVGSVMEGETGDANHVIVVTHLDDATPRRWIGIQGQPGGVGLVDCTPYLDDKMTRSNHAQPKLNAHNELNTFLADGAKTLGTKYDWVGITEDTFNAFGLHDLSDAINHLYKWPTKNNVLPGAVVCSSLAAMLYEQVGWPHPDLGNERMCSPQDWWAWSDKEDWPK